MTDFSTMDPQDLCGWIAQRIDDNWYDNVDLYDPDIGRFHLWACAFAARDYIVNLPDPSDSVLVGPITRYLMELKRAYIARVMKEQAENCFQPKMPLAKWPEILVDAKPLDWLVAAAMVVEGDGK